jgi:phospholipid/cholesterol/gamma-HCH transport system ATP-binding protein
MIEFKGVKKAFGSKVVLRGVNLTVGTSEVVFIVGSSGAGKSVLVKHLIGLLRCDAGKEISRMREEDFYEVRKKCCYIFQHSTLFDSMSILDNVALPLRKGRGLTVAASRKTAMERLEMVQMESYAHRFPAELGAGLQKRVAIARGLTLDPAYVIYDEPTTSLDPVSARRVDALIRDMSKRVNVTSLVVSHDLTSIFTIADRVAMLYKGDFLIDGPPSALKNSTNPVVEQYVQGRADGPMET